MLLFYQISKIFNLIIFLEHHHNNSWSTRAIPSHSTSPLFRCSRFGAKFLQISKSSDKSEMVSRCGLFSLKLELHPQPPFSTLSSRSNFTSWRGRLPNNVPISSHHYWSSCVNTRNISWSIFNITRWKTVQTFVSFTIRQVI